MWWGKKKEDPKSKEINEVYIQLKIKMLQRNMLLDGLLDGVLERSVDGN